MRVCDTTSPESCKSGTSLRAKHLNWVAPHGKGLSTTGLTKGWGEKGFGLEDAGGISGLGRVIPVQEEAGAEHWDLKSFMFLSLEAKETSIKNPKPT